MIGDEPKEILLATTTAQMRAHRHDVALSMVAALLSMQQTACTRERTPAEAGVSSVAPTKAPEEYHDVYKVGTTWVYSDRRNECEADPGERWGYSSMWLVEKPHTTLLGIGALEPGVVPVY